MKNLYSFFCLILLSSFFNLFGQSQDQNYIKTTELLEPVSINFLNSNSNTVKKIESITYFDGFGKAKQSVAVKQSANKKDIVQHLQYDQFGRVAKQYLPLPTLQNSGNYINNAQSQISTYYQNAFSDQHPFSEVRFDNSPLNRKLESSAPGNAWQIQNVALNNHTTKYDYNVNGENEVFRFEINENDANNPLTRSFYNPKQLLKNIIKNENWVSSDGLLNTKEVFTDKNGRKIAEITYENDGSNVKKLSTYYVYDEEGNLRFILPPKTFTNALLNYDDYSVNWPINDFISPSGVIGSFIFRITNNEIKINYLQKTGPGSLNQYTLNNQTIKTLNISPALPDMYLGKIMVNGPIIGGGSYEVGEASIVNGNLVINRTSSAQFSSLAGSISVNLSLTQSQLDDLAFQYKYDQFNRQIEQKVPGKDWEYMVYDQLDRPILTQDANLKAQNRWLFNKYDTFGRVVYSGIYTSAASRSALQNQVDSYINSSTNKSNVVSKTNTTSTIGGVAMNYTNDAFPTSGIETLTISYFDDYNFPNFTIPNIPSHVLGQEVTNRTKGLLTGSWTKTLGSNSWSKSYTFYNTKGRVINLYDKNHLGGHTENKSKLDFRGKTEYSVTTHKRLNTSDDLTIVDRFEYDHVERPKKHYQQINNQEEELIAQNTYNELGQLEKKNLGGDAGSNTADSFIDIQNVEVIGNTITKTHNSTSWNAGLATKSEFTGDGYVEFEAVYNQRLMVGLSTDNSSAGYNTIDYAIYLTQSNALTNGKKVYIYESGTNKGWKTDYVDGDIFSVERIGTTIHYKKNGETFYTSLTNSSGNLIGDVSICVYNHKIKNLRISSKYTDIVGLTISNTGANSQQIKKENGSTGWNAGLATTNAIKENGNGYLSYKINQTNKYMMVGLSDVNTSAGYNTIDYAIYNHNGTVYVRENGVNKGAFGNYQSHDEFKVERIGTTIYYKKNEETFYTSLVASTTQLIGDMSFYHVGGAIYDVEIQNTEAGLQTIDYNYNIRGWLTNVNDVNNLGTDVFAFNLKYNESTEGTANVAPIYNGNISQIIWKSRLNNLKKSYTFEYDKLNRFKRSYYRENNALTGGAGKYETYGIRYDENGNLKNVYRNTNTGSLMDRLGYTYDGGNKLLSVTDAGGTPDGFYDGSTSGVDYAYDANGNLGKDKNKNITNIRYNHLDLVEEVVFGGGQPVRIEYTYDASGNKLQMKTVQGNFVTTVDYLGTFQYTNSELQFFPTPEGYVANDSGTFKYVYTLRDHLGNNRVSFSDENNDGVISSTTEILSNTDHYVMGLTHQGEYISGLASNYNYKYQGKEELKFMGYNMYDFGSRMYDASTGRWFNADPKNQFMSPYVAMGNNYIIVTDPDGEWVHIVIGAVVGGVVNVVSNCWSGDCDLVDGLAYFAVGAGAGAVTAATGNPVAGGAILGAGNSAYSQYDQTGTIDPSRVLGDAAIGGATAFVGGQLSSALAPVSEKLFSNVGNKLVQQYLTDALTNTVSGVGLTTISGLAQGQSLGDSFDTAIEGIPQSLAISAIGTTGSYLNTKYYNNKQEKLKQDLDKELKRTEKLEIKPVLDDEVVPVNLKYDAGAHALADEIGGRAQVAFKDSKIGGGREFDAVSSKSIGQHKPYIDENFGQSFKKQAKATFEAAKQTNRNVIYRFDSQPHPRVINKLVEYSNRYQVKLEIRY